MPRSVGTLSAHEMTTGRVFYQKINPIKGQIMVYHAGLERTSAGTPFVLPLLETRESHLGNPGWGVSINRIDNIG